ncbi:hypothetical protein K432DRAFT_5366 [Lepidopterella palustris CBS 459.81]|uniref:Uncharacterized protein n=1 Tax=Lepidopterella palustris CBS 459.81 TaxID=1314670 RepID=A0A8E2ED81_9PEZI|nr:hypothetical protein K432DRAFT_5366 [Lepidopterella palustris CBS 459.81]
MFEQLGARDMMTKEESINQLSSTPTLPTPKLPLTRHYITTSFPKSRSPPTQTPTPTPTPLPQPR